MPSKPNWREAVVLSGGGALGAFEVGVMKALYQGRVEVTDFRPIVPSILSGASVGAYNAAYLASRGRVPGLEAIAGLQRVWLDAIGDSPNTCGTQAYRLRTGPFVVQPECLAQPFQYLARTFSDTTHWAKYAVSRSAAFFASAETVPVRLLESLNLASLVSVEPLYQLINNTISLDELSRSPTDVAISATNWADGELRVFHKHDLLSADGLRIVAASAAVPGVFPPVSVRGVPYVDGGVLQNTPIKPAIQCGADVIHVIFLDPQVVDMPVPEVPNTYSTLQRTFAIIRAGAINRDIAKAREVVRELRSLREKGILTRDFQRLARDAPEEVPTVKRLRSPQKKPYRPVVIHKYRPRSGLGSSGGFIDFRRSSLAKLIELGYANAISHNCEQEGCLLAERAVSQAKGESQ